MSLPSNPSLLPSFLPSSLPLSYLLPTLLSVYQGFISIWATETKRSSIQKKIPSLAYGRVLRCNISWYSTYCYSACTVDENNDLVNSNWQSRNKEFYWHLFSAKLYTNFNNIIIVFVIIFNIAQRFWDALKWYVKCPHIISLLTCMHTYRPLKIYVTRRYKHMHGIAWTNSSSLWNNLNVILCQFQHNTYMHT